MKNQNGYTLTELIIAITITAILAGVVFSAFSICRKISHHSNNKIAAINLLRCQMEEIRGDIKINQFDNLSTWQGKVINCVLSEGPTAAKKDDIDGVITISLQGKNTSDTDVGLTDINLAYVEIDAVITWDSLGAPFTESMRAETNITL